MNMNNMGDLLKNAGKIRKQIDRVQEELKERFVEGKAGDGLVVVLINGQQEVVKITIDPRAVSTDSENIEILEDLILAAIAQGVEKSKALKSEEMNKATGGMGDSLSGMLY